VKKIGLLMTVGFMALLLVGCGGGGRKATVKAADIPGTLRINVNVATEYDWQQGYNWARAQDTVKFVISNQGEEVHSFNIPALGVSTGPIEPGARGSIKDTKVTIAAGEYEFFCDQVNEDGVPHRELGMEGIFEVKSGYEGQDAAAAGDVVAR